MIANSDVLLGQTAGGVWLLVLYPKKRIWVWIGTPTMRPRLAVGCVAVLLISINLVHWSSSLLACIITKEICISLFPQVCPAHFWCAIQIAIHTFYEKENALMYTLVKKRWTHSQINFTWIQLRFFFFFCNAHHPFSLHSNVSNNNTHWEKNYDFGSIGKY